MDKINVEPYQVLALDLDGTLLNSNHVIAPYLQTTLMQLSQRIPVILVTGRHHIAAKPYHKALGLKTWIICCNGTYVYDYQNDKVIMSNPIAIQEALALYDLMVSKHFKMVIYTEDAMLCNMNHAPNYMAAFDEWVKTLPEAVKPNIQKVPDLRRAFANDEFIWKIVVEGDNIQALLAESWVENHFTVEQSWVDRFDFSKVGNTKGMRLKTLLAHMNLSPDGLVAAGDNFNDISMFELAKYSIAMQNADIRVQATASYVTKENNDDPSVLADHLMDLFGEP